jgi:hypothetical protein
MRVFDIDLKHCSHRDGSMANIAAILDATVIAKLLAHIGLSVRAPAHHCALPQTDCPSVNLAG